MARVFGPKSNLLARATLVLLPLAVAGFALAGGLFYRSNYVTGVGTNVSQPVPFSHRHHVKGLGLDCRYCHSNVESSAHANLPPTATCMGCHSQIWSNAQMLAPVRESLKDNKPIRWVRVHSLPDYVYFDHSVHVHAGVGCVTCHGQVSEMPLTSQFKTFYMEDCLACHRNPEKYLRPQEKIFDESWKAENQEQLGRELLIKHQIHPSHLTDCYVCHR